MYSSNIIFCYFTFKSMSLLDDPEGTPSVRRNNKNGVMHDR